MKDFKDLTVAELATKYGVVIPELDLDERQAITQPKDILLECESIRKASQENFLVIALDASNKVIAKKVLFVGGLNSTIVDVRVLFWYLLEKKASSFIVSHNHPSGSLVWSDKDKDITDRLNECGDLLGLKLLDHILVGRTGWKSYKESVGLF